MAPHSLMQLLDVAIQPKIGNVNFIELHSLLQAMISHLGLQDLPAQVEEEQFDKAHPDLEKKGDGSKGMEQQPQEPGKDSLLEAASSPQLASMAADVVWMKKKIKDNERSASKAVALSQDLLGQMGGVKAAQSRMEEDIQKIQEALDAGNLQDAASRLPDLRDQSALDSHVEGSGGQFAPTKLPTLDMDTPHGSSLALGLKGPETQPVPRATNGTGTPGIQPRSPGTQTSSPGMQPGSPGTQTSSPEMQPETEGRGAGIQPSSTSIKPSLGAAEKVPDEASPGALGTQMHDTSPKERGKNLPSVQLAQAGQVAAETFSPTAQELEIPLDVRVRSSSQELDVPRGSSGSTSAPSFSQEMVEALRQIGQLGQLYATLKEQVTQLEATKLEHTEVEKLCKLFLEGDQESITSVLADLQDQMSSLQGLASELQREKGKIRQLEDALAELAVAGADSKADDNNQISLKQGAMLEKTKWELKELREQQEMTKSTVKELVARIPDDLQEQLDKMKRMVESMGQKQGELQAQGQAECPVCSTDLSVQVGQLLQRYEKLQEMVDSFTSQQLVHKVARQLPGRSQDKELLNLIQDTIVHLQEDYKKLNSVMGNLLNDSQQKQKDIEALFQSLERLDKDKEDLLLRIDEKADKSALASKVSCSQFEAGMERLSEVIQEMLSRVTGQEQGWHQFQRQFGEEMDSKLDRMELGPFRQQMEEHWRSILEKAKKKGLVMEADDAAGIKKQLLAPFHCLSCDCPLRMLVPGPHVVSIPSMPPLPSRFAGDHNAILKQEQMQQHMHREQVAAGKYPRVPRPCGGQHTLIHRLQHRKSLLPQPSALLPTKNKVMELLGQDGRIYRGQQDGHLPVLVGKEGSWHSQLEHVPASSHSNLSQTSELLLTLEDGSRAPSDGSPPGPPRQPRRRRESGSGQQQ